MIGATGHIGTYLVPQLVMEGHEVITISRNKRAPYTRHEAFERVEQITADRDAEDRVGCFGSRVKALRADVVVDLICYELSSAEQLVDALRGSGSLLIHCGTIWVHGPATTVPMTEDVPRRPMEAYGVAKAQIEQLLVSESSREAIPSGCSPSRAHHRTRVDTGEPLGNLSLGAFSRLAAGDSVCLPNFGLETLHHVHAEDVARAFVLGAAVSERRGRTRIPRRIAECPHPPRRCRGGGGVVRSRSGTFLLAI